MKLIKPKFEILEQQSGLDGIYKQIEIAGRTCYKSEDKITEDSAKDFVEKMIKSGHHSMLEHGTVYLKANSEFINPYIHPEDGEEEEYNDLFKYGDNNYSVCHEQRSVNGNTIYVTTNLRVLVENNWLDDLKYICEPTEYHEKRVTVRFICDRGVSHEFVRHRVFSFAQESTRYCNYSKDKFGNELTFIIPCWLNIPEGKPNIKQQIEGECIKETPFIDTDGFISYHREYGPDKQKGGMYINNVYVSDIDDSPLYLFIRALELAEQKYLHLLATWTPQQARAVLPNSLKTELVMTGFVADWEHFFELRDAKSAHPQAKELAHPLHIEFLRRGYIKDLYDEANPD